MVAFLLSYFQERARVQEGLHRKGLAPGAFLMLQRRLFRLTGFYAPLAS